MAETTKVVISEKDLKKAKYDARFREFKEKVKQKTVDACCWLRNNWEIVSAVGVTTSCVVGKGIKAIAKHREHVRERDLKTRYVYDRSCGHYYHLRRTPTNSDLLELDRRRKDVGLGQALLDMRLI